MDTAGTRTTAPPPVTRLETRSIDYVPVAERHGKVWHLGPLWFAGLGVFLPRILFPAQVGELGVKRVDDLALAVAHKQSPHNRQIGRLRNLASRCNARSPLTNADNIAP